MTMRKGHLLEFTLIPARYNVYSFISDTLQLASCFSISNQPKFRKEVILFLSIKLISTGLQWDHTLK